MRVMIIVPLIFIVLSALITSVNTTEGRDIFGDQMVVSSNGTPFVQGLNDPNNLSLDNSILLNLPVTNETTSDAVDVTQTGSFGYITTFIDTSFKVIAIQLDIGGNTPEVVEFLLDIFIICLDIAWVVDFIFFLRGVT